MFKHPFTMCVAGSTGSGKTEWIMRFLKHVHTMVYPPVRALCYCYGEMNERVAKLEQHVPLPVQLFNGLPTEEQIQRLSEKFCGRLLIVLDDLMIGIGKSQFLDVVFTRGSHNWGVSVILVTQHLFAKELRTPRSNAHYIVLLKNRAGALQIRNLGTQIFPTQLAFFMEAYRDATANPFGYLVIDLHPGSDEEEVLKTNIYPEESAHPIYYVPKENTNSNVK